MNEFVDCFHVRGPFVKDKCIEKLIQFNQTATKDKIRKLEDFIIKHDKTGEWCMIFASKVDKSDKIKLYKAILEKDKTGEWLIEFAIHVDINEMELSEIQSLVGGRFNKKEVINYGI